MIQRTHLKLALLLDAIHPVARRSEEPRLLGAALRADGHAVQILPITAGLISGAPRAEVSEIALDAAADEALATSYVELLRSAPDVICAYDASSPAAWIGARAAKRLGCPLLIVEPGWLSMRSLRDRVLEGFGRRVWGRAVRARAARVLASDPVVAEETIAKGFAPSRVHVLPNGIDHERFSPGRPTTLVAQRRLIGRILLSVGPLEPGRGLERLLQAFAASVGQREDWCLVLVGRGSLERRLRTLATRLGIGARVHILDFPDPDELAGLMGASTLLAVPGSDERVRGNHIPAAMGCGLPVIASNLPRLAFRFGAADLGVLVDPDSTRAWTDAIARTAGAPELRRRLARAGREFALQNGWDATSRAFCDHARAVLAEAGDKGEQARPA